jgi:hypothetical protein
VALMAEKKKANRDGLLRALKIMLQYARQTHQGSNPSRMVAIILPESVIAMISAEIDKAESESGAVKGEPEYIDEEDFGGSDD